MSDFSIDPFISDKWLQTELSAQNTGAGGPDFLPPKEHGDTAFRARSSLLQDSQGHRMGWLRSSTPLTPTPLTPGPFIDDLCPPPRAPLEQTVSPAQLQLAPMPSPTWSMSTDTVSVETIHNEDAPNVWHSPISLTTSFGVPDTPAASYRWRPHHDPHFWSLDAMLLRATGQDLRGFAAMLRTAHHNRTSLADSPTSTVRPQEPHFADGTLNPADLEALRNKPRGASVLNALEEFGGDLARLSIAGQKLTTHDILAIARQSAPPTAMATLCELAPQLDHPRVCHEELSKDEILALLARKGGAARLAFLIEHQDEFMKLHFNDAGLSKADILKFLNTRNDGLSMLRALLDQHDLTQP